MRKPALRQDVMLIREYVLWNTLLACWTTEEWQNLVTGASGPTKLFFAYKIKPPDFLKQILHLMHTQQTSGSPAS